MTGQTPDRAIPDAADRRALNAALHAAGTETGFWDDDGRPAPWPDDIEEWTPETRKTDPDPDGEPF